MARRILSYVVLVAILVAAAVWLADRPGAVTIHWLGWRIDTSVPVLVMAVLLSVAVMALVFRVAGAVVRAPGNWLAVRRSRRTRDGYRALSDGLAAIAAGDTKRARKLAHRADRLLEDHSLTGLLTAQAAELSGDEVEAERRFADMVARPGTAFLGLKGLLQLALKKGDRVAALDYARRAWALNSQTDGLATTLFDLQARAGQWAEAEATLAEAKKRGALSGADLLHRQALALLERSRLAEAAGDGVDALTLALKAHQADVALIPAAARASSLLHRAGKERKAQAVIHSSWEVAPHPLLIAAMIDLAPAETPLQRVKRLEKLVKANPDSPDGHIALAEAALAAKLWGQARTHLEKACGQRPSAGLFILLARLEREERKDEAAAQGWLAKAATAPAEPAWTCNACGRPADAWSVQCPSCGAVDSLNWRQPVAGLLPAVV